MYLLVALQVVLQVLLEGWAVCAVQVEESYTMIYELSRGGGFVGWGWCAGVQFDLPSMGPNVAGHPLHV